MTFLLSLLCNRHDAVECKVKEKGQEKLRIYERCLRNYLYQSQHNKYFIIRDPWSFPNILHSSSDTMREYTKSRNEDIAHSNRHSLAQ